MAGELLVSVSCLNKMLKVLDDQTHGHVILGRRGGPQDVALGATHMDKHGTHRR